MIRERRLIRRIEAWRKPRGFNAVRTLVLSAFCTAGLCGCISDPFNHPTDPTAAGAAQISAVAATPGPYPTWSKFPAAPVNVPTVAMWNAKAKSLDADQSQLLHEAAGLQWTLSDTEGWAAQARSLIDPAMAVPAPPNAQAATEAFAAKARAMAVPPPPGK